MLSDMRQQLSEFDDRAEKLGRRSLTSPQSADSNRAPVAVNFRRGWAGSPVAEISPRRGRISPTSPSPASESMVVAGIHSLALRARIRSRDPSPG